MDQDMEKTDSPRVTIRVLEGEAKPGEFSPLTPPADVEIRGTELRSGLIESLVASFDLMLSHGDHDLPLFEDDVLPVHVPDGCRCRGRVTAGRTLGAEPPESVLTGVTLSFEPPVTLANIPTVLTRLSTHFDDYFVEAATKWMLGLGAADQAVGDLKFFWRAMARRIVSDLDGSAGIQKGLAGMLKGAAARVNTTTRDLMRVALSGVDAVPRERRGGWELVLSFTGRAEYPGGISVPFRHVRLPRFILPIPHASLDKLLSAEPLASARLDTSRLPAEGLARTLLGLVGSFSGEVALAGVVPDVEVEISLAGGGVNRASVLSPGRVELDARLSGDVSPDCVSLVLDQATVRSDRGNLAASGWARASDGPRAQSHTAPDLASAGRTPPARTPQGQRAPGIAWRCLKALSAGAWPPAGVGLEFGVSVLPGAALTSLDVDIHSHHPLLKGEVDLGLTLSGLDLHGDMECAFGASGADGPFRKLDVKFSGGFKNRPHTLAAGDRLGTLAAEDRSGSFGTRDRPHTVAAESHSTALAAEGGTSIFAGRLEGNVHGKLVTLGPSDHFLQLDGDSDASLALKTAVAAFPELSIDEGFLHSSVEGKLEFHARTRLRRQGAAPLEADFSGSTFTLEVGRAEATLGDRKLHVPPQTRLEAEVADAVLSASGLGRAAFDLAWNFNRRSPVLYAGRQCVELFSPEMLAGEVTVRLSPAGGLSVSGPDRGLYDARFFNALLNPAAEPGRIVEILQDDEAMDRLLAIVRVVSERLHSWVARVRGWVKTGREILEAEGIQRPRDAIPGPVIARILSRILCGKPDMAERIYPLVKRVTDGRGLDVPAVKRLVAEVHPDHPYEFEVDRLLRILGRLLAPADPVGHFKVKETVPLSEDPQHRKILEDIPSAAEIYAVVDSGRPFPETFSAKVARIAPYMTLEQVEYLLSRGRNDWRTQDLGRIRTVRELKHRVRMISSQYGGLSFAPQALAISFFLGETLRAGARAPQSGQPRPYDDLVPDGAMLGPEDIAVLLQSGLASAWAGRAVQLNQRMLLDLLLRQPAEFVRATLVELGEHDDRVLASALFALLGAPQDALRAPLDLSSLLSEKLGFEFPRIVDFMAGGRRAGHSYYEALSQTAYRVLARTEPYRALKYYIQEARRRAPAETPTRFARTRDVARLEAQANAALASADKAGARCRTFAEDEPASQRARTAYRKAFSACASLLVADPLAFRRPWFKAFWARNFEALTVASVVRNVQKNVDRVRYWLDVRTATPPALAQQDVVRQAVRGQTEEQTLVDKVIDALYYFPEDRETLRADPLVRLLIDEPPGAYNFTIVSAMGVITAGAKGAELQEAYRRLKKERGVRVVRADTATARSLEYNADRIIDAVRTVKTPYGFIGYSQGCANALMAESMMVSGTPQMHRLLDGLVCRNLLFCAANGSAHGTCGDRKMVGAMVDLDRFLAHYQAVLSSKAISLAQTGIRLLLDSRPFVLGVLGSRSLSRFGVLGLQTGGQFKGTAPTSLCRGLVEEQTLPEALEFLSNVLTRQLESPLHDTQVSISESVGHPIWVTNEHTRVLEECDMGCMMQRSHHWSPLKKDTEVVATRRDVDRAIYDFPKDRHVFPWVEVNARFGLIRRETRDQTEELDATRA